MRFRKLRIAFSVFWGLACVLLIVLWVRSYWFWDNFDRGAPISSANQSIDSLHGYLSINEDIFYSIPEWMIHARITPMLGSSFDWTTYEAKFATARGVGNAIPDWLLVAVAATAEVMPWFRWRFSLRTLLIATTLVAVVMGVVVWLR